MVKIFLPGSYNGAAKVWFEADRTDAGLSPSYALKTLQVDVSGITGRLVLSSELTVPDSVLSDRGADKQLKTWKEAVEQAEGETRRRGAVALDKLYQDFRKCAIKADGTSYEGAAADFLGISGIAEVATQFSLEINPEGLLPAGSGNDRPIFRAEAEATFAAAFRSPMADAAVDAVVRIEIVLTRAGVLQLLPRVQVPKLPHLGFTFPPLDLPGWSLDGLQFPELNLQFFQLPLQAPLGVDIAWTPRPQANFSIAGGKLKLGTSPSTVTVTFNSAQILTADGVVLTVDGSEVTVTAANIAGTARSKLVPSIDLSDAFGPLKVVLSATEAEVGVSTPGLNGPVTLKVTLTIGRILIQARTDPSLVLAVAAALELTYLKGTLTPKLTQLDIVEPYPIKLALVAADVIEDGVRRLLSLIQKIDIPTPGAPPTPDVPSIEALVAVLRRIAALAAAAAKWLAQQGIAAARALAGLAEAVLELLGEVIAALGDAIKQATQVIAKYVVVEVRIDVDRWRVVQVIVTPSDPEVGTEAFTRSLLGFKLSVPYESSPALVCDFDQGWMAIALQTTTGDSNTVTLSTDLWLENAKTGTTEPVSGAEVPKPSDEPLLKLAAEPKKAFALALAGIDNGKAFFLRKLTTTPSSNDVLGADGNLVIARGHLLLAARLSGLEPIGSDDFIITPAVQENRILSLFRSAAPSAGDSSGGLAEQLSQHIRIVKVGTSSLQPPALKLPVEIEIKISDAVVKTTVTLSVDLESLSVRLDGGRFDIDLREDKFDLLGLKGTFVDKQAGGKPDKPLFLDLSDGDPRLGLNDHARIDLAYDKLSNSGKGLGFSVDQFVVSRDGIDLGAAVKNDEPVTLAGVDMPFRFDHGQLSVKRSRIQTFAITGHGNLPPALVGEAKASIELNFTQQDGALALQAAKAVLDKTADPLRCEGTQFSITITKLGLKYVEQGGYHFYFTLTGAAEFRPSTGAFADGLLKNLSSLKIVLNEAPLAADPRVLLKHIEFQVPVDPPKRSTFFDLFSFELRGIGFHPASDAFGGSSALSISGQVSFTDFADIVTPRFDFHKLWIAPPEAGKVLPRIRFDGLGVGLSLGSMAEASGTAIAVDGKLPTLFKPDALPADVTANGFLASGSLRIQGWASMSASMGFLELEKAGVNEKRQAFFLYLQRNDMSEKIPTPVGTIYLREVGFGFGYRYTLAGIAAADRAETPRELVKILDEVSKYQGSLDDVRAWLPTFDNAALTLALRGLFSITTASSSSEYNEKKEKDLPNLVLFDIVAALRTDLTFLMNMRAWIAYNYADWREARQKNSAWRNSPTLTGYMYLSVPRREFLARAVYNPGAEIGNHPKLPEPLKTAMRRVRWSSTLYIRPGLFHMEFGWPYELGFFLGDPTSNFYLAVEGGTVLRFEEAAVLYGLAFRARGFAKFEYSTGGSFGAAISARADFALGAKLIAYLSANISESMFYGVITLDVTLAFSVRMWLNTRWFSLSVSFSGSLTIHVGIELLLEPSGLAARIEASVAVGAFGRTLSLGIGFTLGSSGRLDMARLRVERFLALGLGTSYPDPEAGVPVSRPAPLPEPSRAGNAIASDKRVEQVAERVEATAPREDDGMDPLRMPGREFGDVHYWVLLFPISTASGPSQYLAQLVPRDASPPGSTELLKATHFYAAPMQSSDSPTYVITGVSADEILSKVPVTRDPAAPGKIAIRTDWAAPFGLHGAGENARQRPVLREAFEFGCFMAGKEFPATDSQPARTYELTDIETIPWDPDEVLPDDPEKASIALKAAARSRAECGPQLKRVLQVDEARSCFIATVADCAGKLAAMISLHPDGKVQVDEDRARELEFDPRAIGLTFVLTEARLKTLFAAMDRNTAEPPVSDVLTVTTRIPMTSKVPEHCKPTAVALFNPPERMFHRSSPVLKDRRELRRATGILLHWDLEWRWTASRSIFADPEYHLKHYRIERRIENLAVGQDVLAPAPRVFEVKKSDHLEILLHKDPSGAPQLRKRRYRSQLQFADDLKDVPAELRAQLLLPAIAQDRGLAARISLLTGETRIVYSVLGVDCAGTSGMPAPDIEVVVRKPDLPEKSVLKAIARFQYDKVPALGEAFDPESKAFLQLTIEEEEETPERFDEDKPPVLGRPHDLQLRIRTERTIAVGLFGADALSQARAEPPVPSREERDPGAGDADVTLKVGAGAHTLTVTRVPRRLAVRMAPGTVPEGEEKVTDYSLSSADWRKLRAALDIESTARVRAARLYIRPVPTSTVPEKRHLDPEWIPVQLQMQIGPRDEEAAVDITIERFEHPIDVRFQALTSTNIVPSSGRLHLYHPASDASLRAFLTAPQPTPPVSLLRDGERRTAVTLAWNARPTDIGVIGDTEAVPADAPNRHSLLVGYDLFALDATAVPKGATVRPGWPERFVTPVGRVQRLPAAERGQEPSETGDFARVEVLYPSETRRLETAAFGKRRATWFSPAESFLLWPCRVLRRSLLTLPDEVDIAALFARGRPARIHVGWHLTFGPQTEWPTGIGAPPTFAILRKRKGEEEYERLQQPTGGFTPADLDVQSETFTVEQVRLLLLSLVVNVEDARIDARADELPDSFADLAIALTPRNAAGVSLGLVTEDDDGQVLSDGCVVAAVALSPVLHPILADVLDLVQYERTSHSYRRFEPVLDMAPATNAERLSAFLDETPADRDPSGWGVLRTLGLAAAFRLYDVEAGSFLPANETLSRLNDALAEVLPRYRDVPDAIGAPFVDVMFTSDGLAEAVSFHGTAPIRPDAASHLREKNALALVQVELRPTPQPLGIAYQTAQDKRQPMKNQMRIVRYATLRRQAAGDATPPAEDLLLTALQPHVLLEVEPLVRTAGQTARRILLMKDREGQKFPKDAADTISSGLRLQPQAGELALGYIRFITFDPGVSLDRLEQFVRIERVSSGGTSVALDVKDGLNRFTDGSGNRTAGIAVEPATDLPAEHEGPWGRFADLPDTWLAALLFGDGLSPSPLPPGTIEQRVRTMPFGNTLATLMRVLGRTQDKPELGTVPDHPDKRLSLAAGLGPWTRRFMERGPAAAVPQADDKNVVGLAFAMLTRPNPWRLGPDGDGRLSVTLFEKDRFGKMRKYAVRPFGRYENLVRAAEVHSLAAWAAREKQPAPALPAHGLDSSAFMPHSNPLYDYFADVVVERTEPLSAPVILAARRNNMMEDGVLGPGNSVQVIVSRHSEEILADANIRADAGLAVRHVAVGFWREFATPKWAREVEKVHPTDPINLLEPFGPFKNGARDYARLPEPEDLVLVRRTAKGAVPVYELKTDDLRGWYERHPDLWRGSYVLTIADMPYGFQLHATAHAAAGVVVSPTTVATIGEAGYRLVLPWRAGKDVALTWQARKVPQPSWKLDDPSERAVIVRWALVRIIDGLHERANEIWLGKDAAPAVYRLPDPAVSYRLSIETSDGRVRVGESEFSAISRDPDNPDVPRKALYLAQAIGARFDMPQMDGKSLQRFPEGASATNATHYELTAKLPVKAGDAKPPPPPSEPVFSVRPLPLMPVPEGLNVNPADMAHWGHIAPSPADNGSDVEVSLILTPPNVPDPLIPPAAEWVAFRNDMAQFITAMQAYANGPGPQRVKTAAAAIVARVAPYVVDTVAAWLGPRNAAGTIALPVTLAVPWLLGLPAVFPHVGITSPSNGWSWPGAPGRDAGLAAFREQIAKALSSAGANAELTSAIADALRRYAVAWMAHGVAQRRHEDEKPWRCLPCIRRAAPEGIVTSGLSVAADGPFDFIASVTLPMHTARTDAQVEAAFVALETVKYAAEVLESLANLWSDPQKSAEIRMRWAAHAAIETVLRRLPGGGALTPEVTGVLLCMPALTSETGLLSAAHAELPGLLDGMTEELLFGPSRRLLIQAFHGLAQPQEDPLERHEP